MTSIPWLSGDANVQCVTSLQIRSYYPFSLCVGELTVPDYTPLKPINGTEVPSYNEYNVATSVTAIGQWKKLNAADAGTQLNALLKQGTMIKSMTLSMASGACPATSYKSLPALDAGVSTTNIADAWQYFTNTPSNKTLPTQSYLSNIVNPYLKVDTVLQPFQLSGSAGKLSQLQFSDRSIALAVSPATSGGTGPTLIITRSATLTVLPIKVTPLPPLPPPPSSSKTPSSSSSGASSGSRPQSDGGHGSATLAFGVVGGVAGIVLLATVIVMVMRRRARSALPKESVLTDAVLNDTNV